MLGLQRGESLLHALLDELLDLLTADEETDFLEAMEDALGLLGADVARYESACERVDDLAERGLDGGLEILLVTLETLPDRGTDQPRRLRAVLLLFWLTG